MHNENDTTALGYLRALVPARWRHRRRRYSRPVFEQASYVLFVSYETYGKRTSRLGRTDSYLRRGVQRPEILRKQRRGAAASLARREVGERSDSIAHHNAIARLLLHPAARQHFA
eukprot:SAG11_NODE_4639_length_1825_cov_1.694670_1_plen_115_part_00